MSPAAARILGTRIVAARDDARPRTILLSDLHVTRAGGAPLRGWGSVLDDAAARAAETRVLILGDLFDFYATGAQLDLGGWAELTARIRGCVDAGVSVTVLHGNRDFLLGRRFARRSGARVVAGGLSLRLGALRVLTLHGDETCLRDTAYQRLKRVLRQPLVRSVLKAIPPGPSLRIARRLRRESQSSYRPEDRERYDATRDAIETALRASAADLLVFGHVHRASWGRVALPGGREPLCVVLPAFDEAGEHLGYEAGELFVRGPDGRRRAEFPARTFV